MAWLADGIASEDLAEATETIAAGLLGSLPADIGRLLLQRLGVTAARAEQ